jgi:prophage regulatory protein
MKEKWVWVGSETPKVALGIRESIIYLPEVKAMTGLSASTIWRKEKKGTFPKRYIVDQKSVGWLKSDIKYWLTKKPLILKKFYDSGTSILTVEQVMELTGLDQFTIENKIHKDTFPSFCWSHEKKFWFIEQICEWLEFPE